MAETDLPLFAVVLDVDRPGRGQNSRCSHDDLHSNRLADGDRAREGRPINMRRNSAGVDRNFL